MALVPGIFDDLGSIERCSGHRPLKVLFAAVVK